MFVLDGLDMGVGYRGSSENNPVNRFVDTLRNEMNFIAKELNSNNFIMPVGLFFILDESQGGDPKSIDLLKKYKFLNVETSNYIDFYFIGWNLTKQIFDFKEMCSVRKSLKKNGVNLSFCNSELVLIDAVFNDGTVYLDFNKALSLNIDKLVEDKIFTSLLSFIDTLIQVCKQLRQHPETISDKGVTWSISDKLGISIASKSILEFIFKKFGKIIGAEKLSNITIRSVGPKLSLGALL